MSARMNYINRLESERDQLLDDLAEARVAVADLERYLLSTKFHNTPTEMRSRVEVQDVFARLAPVKLAIAP